MARPTIYDRPLTNAEKHHRKRVARAVRAAQVTSALQRIATIRTVKEAREIAAEALEHTS